MPIRLQGYIRDLSYTPKLVVSLPFYSVESFDINTGASSGILRVGENELAYSKWVSPKRTRSYPFARIYNTYGRSKVVTVIPILKDEGVDGDLDRIQFSTISWMNLMNVYIVLAYYGDAAKNRSIKQVERQKLTNQIYDNTAVLNQMHEINDYKLSALHWNRSLFESRFTKTFEQAMAAYAAISEKTDVKIHDQFTLQNYIRTIQGDYAEFKRRSNTASARATLREYTTTHRYEYLTDGDKAIFEITNYLGGVYFLTADEVIEEQEHLVIQESKNSTAAFPAIDDIKDGLFKLILFSNLDSLEYQDKVVPFRCRLKLTGPGVVNQLRLPCDTHTLQEFAAKNKRNVVRHLSSLNREVAENKIEIEIGSNQQ